MSFKLSKIAQVTLSSVAMVASMSAIANSNAVSTLPNIASAQVTKAKVASLPSAGSKRYIVSYKAPTGPVLMSAQASQQALAAPLQKLSSQGIQPAMVLAPQQAVVADLNKAQVSQLLNDPSVAYVEEDLIRYPLAQGTPYGFTMVQADKVSDVGATNMKVCVIDSGLALPHEDFQSANITGTNDRGTGNWNTAGGPHGTHVAGTIAALNNGVGVKGVLPNGNVKLHIVKVFNEDGWGYSSSLVNAINTCVNNGAKVVNMSLGGAGSSTTEANAMQAAVDKGVLLIAAAGNDGNTSLSYPASYDAVVSVAAIDANKKAASFSQRNAQVELAAPGVDIRSTYPEGTGAEAYVNVGSVSLDALHITGTPTAQFTGTIASCGLGTSPCAPMNNKICLFERGGVTFGQKVKACQDAGGSAAVIYNNVDGSVGASLGDSAGIRIPAWTVSKAVGQQLLAQQGKTATVFAGSSNYGLMSGTSMASPHVAGVAALVWSQFPTCTNKQIRAVLAATAEDLGDAGRDHTYGFGLVRSKNAVDYIQQRGCDGKGSGGGTGGGNGGGDTGGGNGGGTGGGNGDTGSGDGKQIAFTLNNLAVNQGSFRYYSYNVPAGKKQLIVTTKGGTGNVSLLLRKAGLPSATQFDCRSANNGNVERCVINNPAVGSYYFALQGVTRVAGVTMTVSFN